jgi:hypothetical protein
MSGSPRSASLSEAFGDDPSLANQAGEVEEVVVPFRQPDHDFRVHPDRCVQDILHLVASVHAVAGIVGMAADGGLGQPFAAGASTVGHG